MRHLVKFVAVFFVLASVLASITVAPSASAASGAANGRKACNATSQTRLVWSKKVGKAVTELYRSNASGATTMCAVTVQQGTNNLIEVYLKYGSTTRHDAGSYNTYAGPLRFSVPVGGAVTVWGHYLSSSTGTYTYRNLLL